MAMFRRSLLACLFCTVIMGCTSQNVQQYSTVDQSDKTVMIPSGVEGVFGELKAALSKRNWSMVVYRVPSVTEGVVGEQASLTHSDTFNSRHSLLVASRRHDFCWDFSPAIT